MILEDTGINGQELSLHELDHILSGLGFVRCAWDHDHATYDYKYEVEGSAEVKAKNDTYYLRITGDVIEGNLLHQEGTLRLHPPYMGKATFPHGVAYDVSIPKKFVKDAREKLEAFTAQLPEAE